MTMATKQQVARLANKIGCEFRVDGPFVDLIAPEGKHLDGERHIIYAEAGLWQTKAEIYEELVEHMATMTECDCA